MQLPIKSYDHDSACQQPPSEKRATDQSAAVYSSTKTRESCEIQTTKRIHICCCCPEKKKESNAYLLITTGGLLA